MRGLRVLLVITGGIAAYKSLELIRRLRERGATVRCILTKGGAQFVTPLSVTSLSEVKVYSELFTLTDEAEMGHIRLTREADLVVVAPATADFLAKMAYGLADDLASAALLASDKPVMVAPAMNWRMWEHAATRTNMGTLQARGVTVIAPGEGAMACGEHGQGRMAEPAEILAAIERFYGRRGRLAGRRALVTSGPTHEPIDPMRYLANRSSGKQGHAIAAAVARLGAETTLVTGPTRLADPPCMSVVHVETAREMMEASLAALPADVAVCAAAVADWRPAKECERKMKKNGAPPPLRLAENPDILKRLAQAGNVRPALVVGFAAETGDAVALGRKKLAAKGCDWIVANDVSAGSGTIGGDTNTVHLITADGVEDWPEMSKDAVAARLATRIAEALERPL